MGRGRLSGRRGSGKERHGGKRGINEGGKKVEGNSGRERNINKEKKKKKEREGQQKENVKKGPENAPRREKA